MSRTPKTTKIALAFLRDSVSPWWVFEYLSSSLRPGMMLLIHGSQAVKRQVRVNLRGGNIGMAQDGLHSAKVCAVFHHVCSAGMT